MDWKHIEKNWDEFKWKFKQNWTEVSDQQLDMVAGNRERISRVIQRTYQIGSTETEQQLSDWQNAQINIDGHYYVADLTIHRSYR